MINPDYNTWEDYSQFVKLLKLHGFKTHRAVYVVNAVRLHLMAKRLRAQRKAAFIYQMRLDRHRTNAHGRSDLACIVVPYTDRLSSIPAYHRFVAWVLKDGVRQAAPRLGVSRMFLYRWMVKNHYHLTSVHCNR